MVIEVLTECRRRMDEHGENLINQRENNESDKGPMFKIYKELIQFNI